MIAGTALSFAARWWKPLAGALAVIALLLLYRAQIGAAETRGREACEAAEAHARQVWRDSYDQRRAEHQAADEAKRDSYEREAAPIRERIIVEAARPGACRHSDDVERLLEAQLKAANRQLAAASGGAVQGAADPGEGNGAERAGK